MMRQSLSSVMNGLQKKKKNNVIIIIIINMCGVIRVFASMEDFRILDYS